MTDRRLKIDPKNVEYDGSSFRLIIDDEEAFKKRLLERQAEIIKDIEETGGPQ